MATLPATAVGEVRLTLRVPVGDGTDAPAQGYAWLYPNLRLGTTYRASNVDLQVAEKVRVTFDGSGQIRDPDGADAWPQVLASDAPGATHAGLQWVLEFHLDGVERQPATKYFTVPAGSFVNVGLLADTTPVPSVQTIYINSAPILTALNTTDSAVANLVNTTSSTRTALDARYARTTVGTASDLAALAALTGMATGDLVPVTEGGAIFRRSATAWVQATNAIFASAAARDAAYVKASSAYLVAGARVFRSDTGWIEQYYPADATITPNRPAGWYPVEGPTPGVKVDTSGSVANNSIPALTLTETAEFDGTFTTSGTTLVLPALHGWWRLEHSLAYASNSTGGRHNVVTVDGTNIATNGVASDLRGGFFESYSTVSTTILLAGGNTIRAYAGNTSGVTLTAAGKLTAVYVRPA